MKKSSSDSNSFIGKTKINKDLKIFFSFQYFDSSDEEACPQLFKQGYTQTLMERLKVLSAWTPQEFMSSRSQSVRTHPHDWSETSRPHGFQHLNEELRASPAWQFHLSSNKHGRVHGFFIGNIFHVVWLDQDHKIYPRRK